MTTSADKLQPTFEFLRGVMTIIHFQSVCTPDQTYTREFETLTARTLYLDDLSYFVLARFHRRHENPLYFPSRFDTQTALLSAIGGTTRAFALITHAYPKPSLKKL